VGATGIEVDEEGIIIDSSHYGNCELKLVFPTVTQGACGSVVG
jgi:hypothetical protein